MAQGSCKHCLLKSGIGGDDLLDRGQHRCFDTGSLHGVGQQLLPAGTVHRHSGKVGFGQKIKEPSAACPGRAAVDGFHEYLVFFGPAGNSQRTAGAIGAELDADIKPAGELWQGVHLQLVPFGAADGRFEVVAQPQAQTLDVEVNVIVADLKRNAYNNAIADENATTFAAKDGSNLVLSLDVNVQEIVERYLNEAIAANTVENRGAAIVMNVKTGAILAMASKPDFDPNDPLDYSANLDYLNELVHAEPELYGIYKKDANGNELKDANGNRILDEEADYSGYFRDIQWKNKTITELYYPGSVFKVITSAMGVDSGLANINTTFTCAGAYGVAKETYHCAGHKAHGTINLADALRQSCNIYYIQLGQRIGSQTFYNYFDAFGFTDRTGVDLPSETGFMQYYKGNQLGEVQLASSAFGQAMAITPLQMCTAVAAAVNGGYLVTPHVVDKITDANGNVIEEIGANVRRQVVSESTSNVIRQIMEYEVGAGTGGGKYAYVSGYRIGGKSGTSEQLNMDRRADGDYKKVASFAAVLPADDPEIIVYVMLDDPNNARTDYSSLLAAPVVGNIISEIAPYLGIAADGEDRSQTVVTVPNLVGTEWSSAQVQMNIKGLKHQLAESTASQAAAAVTYQYPHAGAKVAYGTTVYLYTDTYEGSHTEVPDVTGKSADFASQMLSAAGLNCVVEGNTGGTVQAQSAEPGSSVQRGTIVTITCG